MSNSADEWIGCRFNIDVCHFDDVELKLQHYTKGDYIIAHEVASQPHYHILFQGTDQDYKNFSQTLKRKYNLNMNGKKHEYRRDNQIRSLEQYQKYILKDGNYRSNMTPEKIKELYSQSYPKEDVNPENDKIVQELLEEHVKKVSHLLDHSWQEDAQYNRKESLRIRVIQKMLQHKIKNINKCRVNKIAQNYLREYYDTSCNPDLIGIQIYEILFK